MRFVGLLMTSGENDVLERTLTLNMRWLDRLYVLSGDQDADGAYAICDRVCGAKLAGFFRDSDLPDRFPQPVRDGARQHLHREAAFHHMVVPDDHLWCLLIHGDEVWADDPRDLPTVYPHADGFVFLLPLYFPREGEPWQPDLHPLDQLRWNVGPGWPEFRMFRHSDTVTYDPAQHFNVTPAGVRNIEHTSRVIRHYPFRSPTHQRDRAARHLHTGFDPDNYRHITDHDLVYWTDHHIAQQHPAHHHELRCDQ